MWDVTSDVFLGTSSNSRTAQKGRAIWEFDGSTWMLKSLESIDGGVAGDPPTVPGRFKGQLRVTPCVAPELV